MHLTGEHLIAGRHSKRGSSGFRAHAPAEGRDLEPTYADATEAEVGSAVAAATSASRLHGFADPPARSRLLTEIADRIVALGDELIDRAVLETALSPARLRSERTRTVHQLRLFADVVAEGSWVDARIETAPPVDGETPQEDIRRMLVPMGPVAVFGASNFPLAFSVAGGDTASALAAGCPVVVKAHPSHPGTSELVGRAISEALAACDLPQGVVSLLHGAGHQVGQAIVQHPDIEAAAFTGSHAGGRALFDLAATRNEPIPMFAEMGSINPTVLLPDALEVDAEEIAAGFVDSLTLGVGQFCTNPGLVLAMDGQGLNRFLRHCRELIESHDPGTMLSPRIRAGYEEGLTRLDELPGIDLASTFDGDVREFACAGRAALYVTDVATFLDTPELSREVFGPASIVVRATDANELSRAVAHLPGALVGTVHAAGADLESFTDVVETLQRRVGRFLINGFPTGVKVGHAMQHGGPYPATTDARFTSVGTAAILRFARPLCYQAVPEAVLPAALQSANPLQIWRLVDGVRTQDQISR